MCFYKLISPLLFLWIYNAIKIDKMSEYSLAFAHNRNWIYFWIVSKDFILVNVEVVQVFTSLNFLNLFVSMLSNSLQLSIFLFQDFA